MVTLDGNEVCFPDVNPFIDERDKVLVPIRFVSEALGATVDWENGSHIPPQIIIVLLY